MQKKSTIKFLLIGIFLALFLLMLGGNVKAENVDSAKGECETFNNVNENGQTIDAIFGGINWRFTILEKDDGTPGKVKATPVYKDTNQKAEVNVPAKVIFFKSFLGIETGNNSFWVTQVDLKDCPNMTSVKLPDSLESLSNMDFSGSNNLQSIEIKTGQRNQSFNPNYSNDENGVIFNMDKTSLLCYPQGKKATTYEFPINVTSIGKYAFYQCQKLTTLTIPNTVTSIGTSAFDESLLQEINFSKSIQSMGERAFHKTKLVEVVIPDSITSIEKECFMGCENLTKVVLPKSIGEIKQSAFANCTNLISINLENMTIKSGPKSIEDTVFYGCTNLKDITFPEDPQVSYGIGEGAFYKCSSLEFVSMPNSLCSIGKSCFGKCTNLKTVWLSFGIQEIPSEAFYGCISLKEVSLPGWLQKIDRAAFGYCGITKIEIPEGTTTIDQNSFIGSTDLKTIVLPSSCTNITKSSDNGFSYLPAFAITNPSLVIYCTANSPIQNIAPAYIVYEKVTTDNSPSEHYVAIKQFNDVKEKCTEINMPGTIYKLPVKQICNGTFKEKVRLTKIVLSDSLTAIGEETFAGCTGLKDIKIPKNIETIGKKAFAGNTSLSKVIIENGSVIKKKTDNPQGIENDAFENCAQDLKIYYNNKNIAMEGYSESDSRFVEDSEGPTASIKADLDVNKKFAILTIDNIKDEGSGVYQYEIELGSESFGIEIPDPNWKDIDGSKITETITTRGPIWIKLSDMMGNISTTFLEGLEIDNINPVIDGDINVTGGKEATISAKVTDEGGSGLDVYAISTYSDIKNVTEWKNIPLNGEIKETVLENNICYYLYIKDKAGNSNYKTFSVDSVDNEGPSFGMTTTIPNGRQKITVTVEITDSKAGLVAYAVDMNQVANENTDWINLPSIVKTTERLSIDIEAPGTYYIHAKDAYGNVSTTSAIDVQETALDDTIAPRIEFGEKTNLNVAVKITDAYSGIAAGANVGYSWSESNTVEPTTFNPVTLQYNAGDKIVNFNAEANSLTGTYYLWIKVGTLKDVKGNVFAGTTAISDAYIFDNIKPTIISESSKHIARKESTVVYPIEFKENVVKVDGIKATLTLPTGVTGEIISITENTGLTKGTKWNINVKAGDGNGEIKINIPQGLFKDEAGNTLDKDYVFGGINIDNTNPNLTISKPSKATVKQNGEVTYTVTSSEAIRLIEAKKANVTIIGATTTGTLKSIVGTEDGKSWTVTLIGGIGNEDVTLTLPAGLFQDMAGNESNVAKTTEENKLTFDNTMPTITISEPDKTFINSKGEAIYTITSEDKIVRGEGTATITGNVGVSGIVTAVQKEENGEKWEVKVTGAQGEGAVQLIIPTGYFTDEAGNPALQTTKPGLTLDNTIPTLQTTTPTLTTDKKSAEISITTSDTSSGIDSYALSIATSVENVAEDWIKITSSPIKIEIKSNGTYYVYVKDKAGNVVRSDSMVIQGIEDNIAPEIKNISEPTPKFINKINTVKYVVTMSEAVTKAKEDNTISVTGTGITGGTVVVKQNATANSWIIEVTGLDGKGNATLNIPVGFFKDEQNNYTTEAKTKEGLIVDNTAAKATLSYEKTEKGIIAKIVADEALRGLEGWTLSKTTIDNDTLTKTFVASEANSITITDLAGNTTPVVINVKFATTVEISSIGSLKAKESKQLTATVKSGTEKATIQDVTWSSDNLNVVTVNNNGVITGVTNGTANVTATAHNGIVGKVVITVNGTEIVATGVSLDVSTASLAIGGTKQLTATVTPTNATNKQINWSSSDQSVATVNNNGLVTAVKAGTATITAKLAADETKTATCSVTVNSTTPIIGITLDVNTATLAIGGTKQLTATVMPANATNKQIKWSSSDQSVATVNNSGLVTAVKAGTTTITATSEADNTKKATCSITVTSSTIPTTGVTLDVSTATLAMGGTKQLTATVTPANATNKLVRWETSDQLVATVNSNGLVTAIKEGTATITAISEADNTKKANCKIIVLKDASGFTNESGYGIKEIGEIKYLIGIDPETRIETLIRNVETGYTVKITDENGTEITDKTKYVGTKQKVIISKGSITINYIAVVKGDCTGDGRVNALDLIGAVKQYKYARTNGSKGVALTGANLLSIKFTEETSYTAKDLIEEVKLYKKCK